MRISKFAALGLLLSAACASKQKIMDVPVVSMTHSHVPENKRLQETGPVTGKYCQDTLGDKGTVGLFDEALKAAQAQGSIDFVTNASFFREGGCVSVEGTGQKLVNDKM